MADKEAKAEEERIKKIEDLRAEADENEVQRQINKIKLKRDREKDSLSGSDEQNAEAGGLIDEIAQREIDAVLEKEKEKLEKVRDQRKEFEQKEAEAELEGVLQQIDQRVLAELEALKNKDLTLAEAEAERDRIKTEAEAEKVQLRIESELLTEEEILELKMALWEEEYEAFENREERKIKAADKAAKEQARLQKKTEGIVRDSAESMGQAFALLFSGQEDAAESFGKLLIGIIFDTLEAAIRMNAISALAVEVGTKGFLGLPTGLLAQSLVLGLLKGLKTVVNGAFEDGGQIPQSFPAKTGGTIKGPDHTRGGVKFVTPSGFLGEAKGGELILNDMQQIMAARLFGNDVFQRIGVPNVKKRNVYNDGGFIPLVASQSQIQSAQVATQVSGGFDQALVAMFGQMVSENNSYLLKQTAQMFGDEINKERRLKDRRQEAIEINRV